MVSASPTAEFEDHEYPVHSVAIDSAGELGAAGAEDGAIVVWNLLTHTSLFHYQCSPMKRTVTSMKWIPNHPEAVAALKHPGFSDKKLVAATADGKLICIDADGKLFAAIQLDVAILAIDTDGRLIVGGGSDGSLRVWNIQGGKMREIVKIVKAHGGAVTAVALAVMEATDGHFSGSTVSEMLVTGSDDCSIRVWRIGYER